MQRNWIGRSTGASALFGATARSSPVEHRGLHHAAGHAVRCDLYGAGARARTGRRADRGTIGPTAVDPRWTFGADTPADAVAAYRRSIAAKSDLERQENKAKTGVFLGTYATNPANGERIPVFIADYVLVGYGTGAIMAVPGHDQRDWEFATEFGLPIVEVIAGGDVSREAYTGDGACRELGLSERAGCRSGQGDDHPTAGGRRPRPGPRGVQVAGLAVRAAALLGRAASRSCMTVTDVRIRCPSRSCLWCCPTSPTIHRCCSIPTTPTPNRRRRWPRPPIGCTSNSIWATGSSPTPATPT